MSNDLICYECDWKDQFGYSGKMNVRARSFEEALDIVVKNIDDTIDVVINERRGGFHV